MSLNEAAWSVRIHIIDLNLLEIEAMLLYFAKCSCKYCGVSLQSNIEEWGYSHGNGVCDLFNLAWIPLILSLLVVSFALFILLFCCQSYIDCIYFEPRVYQKPL